MTDSSPRKAQSLLSTLRCAAEDQSQIRGLTHRFYRYPARFSPTFAGAAIKAFSRPGQVVLDPFMGGGTTIVEAMVRGRRAIGNDLNSLALFVSRVKTTLLDKRDRTALIHWASETVPMLNYQRVVPELEQIVCARRTFNLTLPIARPIKKVIALALHSLSTLPSTQAKNFARCALLNVGQWALNGRKRQTSLCEFRHRLQTTIFEMLAGLGELQSRLERVPKYAAAPELMGVNAARLARQKPFADGLRADLVVTSPPYPGIHMLYHRWQVDGRRETPAPYWIAACNDGQGAAFYNFADRRDAAADAYFAESLRTLHTLRAVMNDRALIVQMVAFADPRVQLPRYLDNMMLAGFQEVRGGAQYGSKSNRRIWREVPRRRWHASRKGHLNSSREVVLLHRVV